MLFRSENCHAICDMLASSDRLISPTRFHNSVQNVTAGYWGIATGARTNATVVCAYDGSASAGLLEALTLVVVEHSCTLLIAYDCSYPEPLHGARPIADAMGFALLLAPAWSERSLARLSVAPGGDAITRLDDSVLERLRTSIPAARALPLLRTLARCEARHLALEYLDGPSGGGLGVEVSPC